MSDTLRRLSLEWAVSTAGKGELAYQIINRAEQFYDYVARKNQYAEIDERELKQDEEMARRTEQWRDIVSRLPLATDKERDAVLEILADVPPYDFEAQRQATNQEGNS